MKKCYSLAHSRRMNLPYYEAVGDMCYKISDKAEAVFFESPARAFIFWEAYCTGYLIYTIKNSGKMP